MTAEPLIEVTVPASVGEVWAHLREPALIRGWFGWEYDGLAREIEIIFVEEAEADEQARTVAWEHADRFELEPAGDETVLRLYRRVPDEAAGAYDDVEKPGAAAFLTLTAYGDDTAAFDASVASWDAWFMERVG